MAADLSSTNLSVPAAKPSVPVAATFSLGSSKFTIGGGSGSAPLKSLTPTQLETDAGHEDDNKDEKVTETISRPKSARDQGPHVQVTALSVLTRRSSTLAGERTAFATLDFSVSQPNLVSANDVVPTTFRALKRPGLVDIDVTSPDDIWYTL